MEIEDDGTMIYSKAQEDLISENLFKQLWKEWNKVTRDYFSKNQLAIKCYSKAYNQHMINAGESLSAEKVNYHKAGQNFVDHSMKRAVSLKSGMPKIGCLSKYETKITQLACKDYRNCIRF